MILNCMQLHTINYKNSLRLTQTFSRDVKMAFGIEKCKTVSIAKGKLEMRNFTTENSDTMKAMNEDDIRGLSQK